MTAQHKMLKEYGISGPGLRAWGRYHVGSNNGKFAGIVLELIPKGNRISTVSFDGFSNPEVEKYFTEDKKKLIEHILVSLLFKYHIEMFDIVVVDAEVNIEESTDVAWQIACGISIKRIMDNLTMDNHNFYRQKALEYAGKRRLRDNDLPYPGFVSSENQSDWNEISSKVNKITSIESEQSND